MFYQALHLNYSLNLSQLPLALIFGSFSILIGLTNIEYLSNFDEYIFNLLQFLIFLLVICVRATEKEPLKKDLGNYVSIIVFFFAFDTVFQKIFGINSFGIEPWGERNWGFFFSSALPTMALSQVFFFLHQCFILTVPCGTFIY